MTMQPLLLKLQQKREALDKQIADVMQRERQDVLERIRGAVVAYGIKRDELYIGTQNRPVPPAAHHEGNGADTTEQPLRADVAAAQARLPDGLIRSPTGREWTKGQGRKPPWLQKLERDYVGGMNVFVVQPSGTTPFEDAKIAGTPMRPHAAKKRAKPEFKRRAKQKGMGMGGYKRTIRFRDPETGDTWTGQGTMAGWLKRRIEAGADKEQFRVSP